MVDVRALGVAWEARPILAINEKLTCGSEKSWRAMDVAGVGGICAEAWAGVGEVRIDSLRGLIETPELPGKILRRTAINRVEKPPPDAWLGWRLSLSGPPENSVQH